MKKLLVKLEITRILEVRNMIDDRAWVGEMGLVQSSSWVSLFEMAQKSEVRNLKIGIHYEAFIMVAIGAK